MKYLTAFLLLAALVFLFWSNTNLQENFYEWQYDKTSGQVVVHSKKGISDLLSTLPNLPFSSLDKDYLIQTKYKSKKYKSLVSDANFLIIKGKDIFKFVVGDFRIKDFLPRDDYYYENLRNLEMGKEVYWLIDKKLLFKLLELQNALSKNGYNEKGFSIVNGYRHPAYNEKVGGAKRSRHLLGQALDLQIGDINNDGRANQKDKSIVLDLLENEVIGNEGGIGKYPGTMSVHFDVRGFKARWDKQ